MENTQIAKFIFAGIGWMSIATSVAHAQCDVLIVSDTNELMKVNVNAINAPNFPATLIGVTQDSPGSPPRRIRGLVYAGPTILSTLYGITREGDLVTVNNTTGQTALVYSIGGSSGDFWGGLAYDSATNSLYTVNAFGNHELARIDLGGAVTHTIVGSTVMNGGNGFQFQMLGLEFVNGGLLASNRQNDNIVEMNPANGSFVFTWGNQVDGVNNNQQIALNPATGELWGIHDHSSTSNNAALSKHDMTTMQATEMGEVPFGIVESVGGGNDTYGWGGLVFRNPCPADLNEDGSLNFFDISYFINNRSDFDCNGVFDFVDVSLFIGVLISGCP